MEQSREAIWLRNPDVSSLKLHRGAQTVRHCLHILPGERILELGAGSGLWTDHLSQVLSGENPITAAVFDKGLARAASAKNLPNTEVVHITDMAADLMPESFDYIVGTQIMSKLLPEYSGNTLQLLETRRSVAFF